MIPWFQWSVIHIGPLPVQVWGSFVALGMVVSLLIVTRRSERFHLPREQMLDLALWAIIGGLIGSRVFHVLFYQPSFFLAQPLEIIKIWHGGLSSFGGLFGAMVGFALFVKRKAIPKFQFFIIADLMSFAAVFGWIVGRLGCFMIHDHLGVHSTCPLAIQTPTGPRLEMALVEILGMIPLAILFFYFRRKQMREGWYTGMLFVYYGILRCILDFFRATDIRGADSRYIGLTPGQYFAIVMAAVGGYFLYKKGE